MRSVHHGEEFVLVMKVEPGPTIREQTAHRLTWIDRGRALFSASRGISGGGQPCRKQVVRRLDASFEHRLSDL
jgi:hypothetical protein